MREPLLEGDRVADHLLVEDVGVDLGQDDRVIGRKDGGGPGGPLDDRDHGEGYAFDDEPAGIGPEAGEEAVDPVDEIVGSSRDRVEGFDAHALGQLFPPFDQRVGEALDDGERGFNVVARHGEEQPLGLVDFASGRDVANDKHRLAGAGQRRGNHLEHPPVGRAVLQRKAGRADGEGHRVADGILG